MLAPLLDNGEGPRAKHRIGESTRIVLGDPVTGTSGAFDIIEVEMQKHLSALWSFRHLRTHDHLNDIVMDHVHASGERASGGFKSTDRRFVVLSYHHDQLTAVFSRADRGSRSDGVPG